MRLATTAPPHCSGCFAQKPAESHVDFESAWDGPVLQAHGGGQSAVAIDDLILCETCLRSAGALLPDVETDDEVAALRERLADLEAKHATVSEFADRLQEAVALKPDAEEAKAPRLGRRNRSE